jgi:hypothetical protein
MSRDKPFNLLSIENKLKVEPQSTTITAKLKYNKIMQ